MYLKSLTVRGFKSFASTTTLQFEPGITCIVGPNGSGKSNVVDALAWVMGEQGAKSLRGGKMEDVIFAGTSGRPPLGRAEVVLIIDNADGALPIEYTEVAISRTLFRNGGSEYAINGQTCRLLDVQDLLSDSGIGREMHVIVGQGQLDQILHASAEDRRGFVEEAAGVLKHRKRKEKALRKLDATDRNLTRLTDLLSEMRRQLKPLGRQAEVARRASVVQMEVRDARARLLADDVVGMREALNRELAAEESAQARRAQAEADLQAARDEEAELEQALRDDAPGMVTAQETWFGLTAARERLRGTAGLAAERLRNLAETSGDDRIGSDPEQLETEAQELRAREDEINTEVGEHRVRLGAAITRRQQAEAAAAEEERRVSGSLRESADRREGLAQLVGQVNSLRSRAAAAGEEIGRLAAAREGALARAAQAQHDFTALETRIAGLDAGEHGLDAEHEGAAGLLADIDDRLVKLRAEAQAEERERAALRARTDALQLSVLHRKDGGGALLAAADAVPGLAGAVATAVSVRAGYETAVAAALGAAADAIAASDVACAVQAIAHLKQNDLGRAGLVLSAVPVDETAWPHLGDAATYAVDVIEAPDTMVAALRRLLFKTAIVDDLTQAQALVSKLPDVVAVTRDGDQVATHFAAGGSSAQPSLLEVQAAADEAAAALDAITGACERLRFEVAALESERAETQGRADVALAKLHESDAVLAAVAEELGQLGSLARAAKAEADRLAVAISAAEHARDSDLAGLSDLEQRLAVAQETREAEPDTRERDRLADEARSARQVETEARLALRTAEERARSLQGRAEALLRSAQQERDARARAEVRRQRRANEAQTAGAVAEACQLALSRLERTLAAAAERRTQVETARAAREETLHTCRRRVRELETQLGTLTDSVHREELLKAEHRLRMEQMQDRCRDEVGVDLETLVAEYGPDRLVPPLGGDGAESLPGMPFVRAEQQSRLRSAERALAELGRINPLALEEFAALEDRHRFLSEQLDDLTKTRHDLLDIIKEVDKRVEEVFAAAYADVAREFEHIFARLFPGGEGRLMLTEPTDLLASGIEVEARPPGKKIKRLSLLSGGERSLVAVAFLVALFKARPSPFYILDEVEAALDDTNLGRVLEIYEELRETSQLLVITHQKRTMGVADALYGVAMRGDGVSTVISQRLRELSPA